MARTTIPGSSLPYSTAYTYRNAVELVRGGHVYFDRLLELLDKARYTFHLQTYIFESDQTGTLLRDALAAAAGRGVAVYLLIDGYASRTLPRSFIDRLTAAGVHFRFFKPIFNSGSWYIGRRLHYKIAVADGVEALVGGINIGDRYNDVRAEEPAWLDFALWTGGEAAHQLHRFCEEVWNPGAPPAIPLLELPPTRSGASRVRLRINDWVRRKHQISRSYFELFRDAGERLTVLSSYFLPGRVFRRHLARVARRGVRVRVILAGLSDVMLAKYAERVLYGWLLGLGIEVYEYQKTVLHGKLAVADGRRLTLGSYNINNISAYVAIELNLDVDDTRLALETEAMLDLIIAEDCRRITAAEWRQADAGWKRLLHWGAYYAIRLTFWIFTFYYRQRSR